MVKQVFGVDLHTNKFNYCLISLEKDKKIKRGSYYISKNGKGVETFVNMLNEDDMVVIEATSNSFWFARLLLEKTKEVKVINPHKFDAIAKSNKKTDKIDAEKLAMAGIYSIVYGISLPTVQLIEKNVDELRSLFTMLKQLNKKINMTRNNIHTLLKKVGHPYNGVNLMRADIKEEILKLEIAESYKLEIRLSYEELEMLYNHKSKLEKQVKSYAKYYEEEIKIMVSISGVSILTALSIKSDYGEIRNFRNGKVFTSYLGTAPTIFSSNGNSKTGHINKASRRNSLHYVLQMLMYYYTSNEYIKQFRLKLLIGKSRGKTRIAVARKLYRMIFAMLRDKTMYRYMNGTLYEKKLKKLEKIIRGEVD
jgi:transposase